MIKNKPINFDNDYEKIKKEYFSWYDYNVELLKQSFNFPDNEYRKNYEDLVRIFTSEKLWKQFKDLAIVELEFRENIREMISEDKRPNEFAIGVKQILGLLPTAQNRLGSAILIDNYGGSQVSVTRLALEKTIEIDNNIKNTFSFLSDISNNYKAKRKNEDFKITSLIYKKIKSNLILEFIKDYIIYGAGDAGRQIYSSLENINKKVFCF